ncbi:MAG: hypothetical protein ACTHMQ_14520 [Protaetiibacter sp.]
MSETAPAAPSSVMERDPRPALVAAAVVAAILFLELLVSFLESFAFGSQSGNFLSGILLPQLIVGVLPKAVGVFLLLWLWSPRADDRVVSVLLKALVAAAAGCVLAAVVGFVYTVIVYGVQFSDAGALPYTPFAGIVSAVVALAPVVMLVTLAQWVIARGARL